MTATVSVIGYDEGILSGSYVVKLYTDGFLNGAYEVIKKYTDASLNASATVRQSGEATLSGVYSVRPSNIAVGTVAVLPPPFTKVNIPPEKDATLRQFTPTFNYGAGQELIVGSTPSGAYRTCMEFDVSEIPMDADLEYTKLNLPLRFANKTPFSVAVYTTDGDWGETSVHWNSQPRPKSLVGISNGTTTKGTVTIDITDAMKQMFDAGVTKIPLIVQAFDESKMGTYSIYSRESSYSLNIEYGYFTVPPSMGLANISGSATVAVHTADYLSATVEIDSKNILTTLDGSVDVPAIDDTATLDGACSVICYDEGYVSGQLEMQGIDDEAILSASCHILAYLEDTIDGSLTYENADAEATLDASATVAVELATTVSGSLTYDPVNDSSTLDCTATVKSGEGTTLDASYEITLKEESGTLSGSFAIPTSETLGGSVDVPVIEGEDVLQGSATVRATNIEELSGSFTHEAVDGGDTLSGSCHILEYKDTTIDGSFIVHENKTLSCSFDVIGAKFLDGIVRVASNNLAGQFSVALHDEKTISGSFTPKIFWATDLSGSFVIHEHKYVDGTVTVDYGKDLDCSFTVVQAGSYAFIM